ncbi:MAG: hypothetical protein M1832_002495 [Thelocarpon impressellum]|nr:MAG: hypothetical protein M1832_002495 [Thelocarpon impressellum]
MQGVGNDTGVSDPRHVKTVEDDPVHASREWTADVFSGRAHTWDQIRFLKDHWKGPIVLKGIQHVDDARMAVEAGVQGVVLDGAIGYLDVLPEIVEAVGATLTVLFDSGIRTGVDVIKALYLAAGAVLVGRPWVYGLAIGGCWPTSTRAWASRASARSRTAIVA